MLMGRITFWVLLFAAAVLYSSGIALAAETAPQRITMSVAEINEVDICDFITIVEVGFTGNSPGTKVIKGISSYSITTNRMNAKITGVLNTILPENMSIKISLEPPSGAKSDNGVLLTDTPAELVTGITRTAESEKTILYQFSAPKSFQWPAQIPQMITLTISD